MLYGKDVSNWQGNYPWTGNESFGMAKATEGTFYTDAYFAHNWATMWGKKILRGAYHFGHPGTSATAQAAYFAGVVKAAGLGTADVLVLDYEATDGKTPAACAAWAAQFVNTVGALTGKNVWVYVNHSFISGGYCAGLYNHPLWIANPNGTAGSPGNVGPFPVWTVHQYSFQPLDLDVLNGTAEVWGQLVNLTPPAPPKPVFKTVTTAWVCQGQLSLTDLCKNNLGGVAPSTVLQLTAANSPGGTFPAALAAYVSAGDLKTAHVPKGAVLYYPESVKA